MAFTPALYLAAFLSRPTARPRSWGPRTPRPGAEPSGAAGSGRKPFPARSPLAQARKKVSLNSANERFSSNTKNNRALDGPVIFRAPC